MTQYADVALFGTINFEISEIKETQLQGTLKSNSGKTFIEKEIPSRNRNDIQLTIKGVITGLSRAFGETEQTASDRDRLALISTDDGFFHNYVDGKHVDLKRVIIKGSLIWNDDSVNQVNLNPNQFSMVIKEWGT